MFDAQDSLCLPVSSPAISEPVPTLHLHSSCPLHSLLHYHQCRGFASSLCFFFFFFEVSCSAKRHNSDKTERSRDSGYHVVLNDRVPVRYVV